MRPVDQVMGAVMARRARQIAASLTPHLGRGERVLDVGSGTGHTASELQAWGAVVTTADVVDLRVVGPAPVRLTGAELPFATGSFAAVVLAHVLQYPEDPEGLLRECGRVSSGRVLVRQSTYQDGIGRGLLWANSVLWGPLAWGVARGVGWVRPGSFALGARELLSEARMEALVAAAGLRVERREGEPWRTGHVRSDLWVLGR